MPKKGFIPTAIIIIVLIVLILGLVFLKSGRLSALLKKARPVSSSFSFNNTANIAQQNNNLPPCQGNGQLTSSPVDLFADSSTTPLGNLNPWAGHVTPTDHIYINLHHFQGSISDYDGPLFTLKSPRDITLLEIQQSEHTLNGKIRRDYRLAFSPCRELVLFFDHVSTLSPNIQAILDEASRTSKASFCSSDKQGNTGQKMCKYLVSSSVKSAQELGKVAVGFDFGGYDLRTPDLPFINKDRTIGGPNQYFHTICPLDYFSPDTLKASLYQKVNNTSKNASGLPDCGTTMQDKLGTIQGNWYLPDSIFKNGVQLFDGMLAIVHSNTNPSLGDISIGGKITSAGLLEFTPQNDGVINREPSQVIADGRIYCYQGTTFNQNTRIALQLIDAQTLKIESQPGNCNNTTAFVNPINYVR